MSKTIYVDAPVENRKLFKNTNDDCIHLFLVKLFTLTTLYVCTVYYDKLLVLVMKFDNGRLDADLLSGMVNDCQLLVSCVTGMELLMVAILDYQLSSRKTAIVP